MTLHISPASIHVLVAVCAVSHSPVTCNYSPHGDSAAKVILLMLNQADLAKQLDPTTLKKANRLCVSVQIKVKHISDFVFVGAV